MTTETVCYRHTDRATGLRCSKCERPICVECSKDAAVGQRCPECSKELGTTRVQRMATMSPLDGALVTRTILVATAIIWVLGRTSMREELFQYLAYYGPAVAGGEIWRMFSLVLIHASSFWHIGFNMYALYIFGPAIERSLGKLAFMTLYLMTAALGSLVVYLYSHPETVAVGASGAIFGILGMWMYRAYRLRDTAMGQAQLRQYGFMIAINAAIPLFVPSVAWKAHVGGFLAGVLAAYVMSTVKSRKISTGIVALIGVLAAFAPAAL